MNATHHREAGAMPSAEQLLLLRAALLPGPKGQQAGTAWLANADLARVGKVSGRLMPLLYERFRTNGVRHPLLPVLKGLKKHTWYNNRLLFHRAGEAIRALQSAGIDVMVLKGAALSIEYYRDFSLRPMDDVDLLVRYSNARAATQVLLRHGWHEQDEWAGQHGLASAVRDYYHGKPWTHSSGHVVDLHWNLLRFCLGPEADADFWNDSREASFEGLSVRILNPADQLLHICVYGAAWEHDAPIRWIPDALAVLRKAPELDWDRLLAQARNRTLTLVVRGALNYIERNLGDFVPIDVLNEINGRTVKTFEKLEYWQMQKPLSPVVGTMHKNLYIFLRSSHGKSVGATLLCIPAYLRLVWRVGRKRDLPAAFCGKVLHKIGSRLRSSIGAPRSSSLNEELQSPQ